MNSVLSKGLESLIESYAESIEDRIPRSEEGKAFIRLLLRLKPVQEIVLEALGKLTPLLEDSLLSQKKPSRNQKPLFRSKAIVGMSADAQQVIENISQMRMHMERIQESFEEIRDLDFPQISGELYNCLSQNDERISKYDKMIKVLEDVSSKLPPDFLDIRDISHDQWQDHFEAEKAIKKQRDKLTQKEFKLESTYFNRLFFVKDKTGRRICKLERDLKEIQEKSMLNEERMLMEINDLSSTLRENYTGFEDIQSIDSEKIIEDLPAALSKIQELSNVRHILEKKVKHLEKQMRNANHRLTVTGLANADMYSSNTTMRYQIKYLEASFLFLVDLSQLTDIHKEKCKKYISVKNYTKLKSRLENHEMEVSATQEILMQKLSQLKEGINKLLPGINDRKAYLGLFNLVESFKMDNILAESEKLYVQKKSGEKSPKRTWPKQKKSSEQDLNNKLLSPDSHFENYEITKQSSRDDWRIKQKEKNSKSNTKINLNAKEESKNSRVSKFKTGLEKAMLKKQTYLAIERLSSVNIKARRKIPTNKVDKGEKIDLFIQNTVKRLAMETTLTSNMKIPGSLKDSSEPELISVPKIETQDAITQTIQIIYSQSTQTNVNLHPGCEFIIKIHHPYKTEACGSVHIPKIYRLDPFMFKNMRTKTPAELVHFKDSLSSLLNFKCSGTLMEYLETVVDSLPVYKILIDLLKKNSVKKLEKSVQADVSNHLEEFDLSPISFAKALANKSSEVFPKKKEKISPMMNLKLAIKSILIQTDIRIQKQGLKMAKQTDLIEKVVIERVEAGESDPLSQYLRGNTDESLKTCVNLIETNNIKQLNDVINSIPKQEIKPKIAKKWGNLTKKLMNSRALRLGKIVQGQPLLEIWYEMGKSIKYATVSKKKSKESLQLSQKWVYKSGNSSKKYLNFPGKNSLSITPDMRSKKLLTHSKTPESKKYTPTYFKLPNI